MTNFGYLDYTVNLRKSMKTLSLSPHLLFACACVRSVFREASDSDWSSVDNLLVYTLDVDAHLKLKEMSVNSIVFTDATGLESKS